MRVFDVVFRMVFMPTVFVIAGWYLIIEIRRFIKEDYR